MIQSRILIDKCVQIFGRVTLREARETRQALRNALLMNSDPVDQLALNRLLVALPHDDFLKEVDRK